MIELLQTPPIRTGLQEDTPSSPTAKEWYYFWSHASDQINANRIKLDGLVTSGTHASRPDAKTMPEGAIYIESDRDVIYQNQGGNWVYEAGTMRGTLSPDQRPADLGVNDTGFQFLATDAANAQRTFYWSGSAWVEMAIVQYGTHAARPAAATVPARALYIETDRGNAIYQNQGSNWIYVAGRMTGTIAPDQRPAGLGTNDARFSFWATDEKRDYVWLGSAWAAGVAQTPWASDINGASFRLLNAGGIGISTSTLTASFTIFGFSPPNQLYQSWETGFTGAGRKNWGLKRENYEVGDWALVRSSADNGTPDTIVIHCRNNGFVGIGLTVPDYLLRLGADSAAKPTTSTWTVPSDIRTKQKIEPVTDDSLAILDALEWVRYEYNGQANLPEGQKGIGLSAQQIQEHLPEAVRSSKTKLNEDDAEETELLGIDYHHIIVHAARAIQQLAAEVKQLKAMVKQ